MCYCTYLRSVGPAEGIASPHYIFDTLHLLLVAVTVLHGSFLRLLQRTLKRLNSLSRRPKTFLQFWKLTAKICIVTHQLSQKSTYSKPRDLLKMSVTTLYNLSNKKIKKMSVILVVMFSLQSYQEYQFSEYIIWRIYAPLTFLCTFLIPVYGVLLFWRERIRMWFHLLCQEECHNGTMDIQ